MTKCFVKGDNFKCPKCGLKLKVNYQIELSGDLDSDQPLFDITEDMITECIWFDGIEEDKSPHKLSKA